MPGALLLLLPAMEQPVTPSTSTAPERSHRTGDRIADSPDRIGLVSMARAMPAPKCERSAGSPPQITSSALRSAFDRTLLSRSGRLPAPGMRRYDDEGGLHAVGSCRAGGIDRGGGLRIVFAGVRPGRAAAAA